MNKHKLVRLPLLSRDKPGPSSKIGPLDIIIFVILLIFALLVIFPFYYLFVVSITPQEIYANNPFILFTPEITLEAYHGVFTNKAIWNGLGITLILLFGGTAYQLFFTVITGYALSRQNWFGKNFVMNMILVTMFFGGGLIPYYILIKSLGMLDTIWVMIIPGAIDTFNMLLMRNYFASLPKELEESARVDGANDVQIFVKIFFRDYNSSSPERQAELCGKASFIVRKLAHFSIYAALGFCASFTAGKRRLFSLKSLCVVLFGFIYAFSDEFHQQFVKGRSCEFRDMMIDTGGVVTGMAASFIVMLIVVYISGKRDTETGH